MKTEKSCKQSAYGETLKWDRGLLSKGGDSIKNKRRPLNDANSAPGCYFAHTEFRQITSTTVIPSQPLTRASTPDEGYIVYETISCSSYTLKIGDHCECSRTRKVTGFAMQKLTLQKTEGINCR